MTRNRTMAVAILAAIAIIGGLAGTINGLGGEFLADRGQALWRLYAMNTFGGLVTIAVGLIGIGAFVRRSKTMAAVTGVLFLGVTGLTLISLGQTFNVFGGLGSTACFWLMLGIGFTALGVSPEVPEATAVSGSRASRA
ncbi:hypothetical protein BH18ACT17_BH18ACT17_15080 [soil metagenome]